MSRTLRYLRIASSVAYGIACVLLVVLWVKSYCVTSTVSIAATHNPLGVFCWCFDILR